MLPLKVDTYNCKTTLGVFYMFKHFITSIKNLK